MAYIFIFTLVCSLGSVFGLGDFDYRSLADLESTYTPQYVTQKIDHFSFTNNKTYQQRYFVRRDYWKPGGPIIFYLGAEEVLSHPKEAFIRDLARHFRGLSVDAEHRFYGDSQPFGKPLEPQTQQDPEVAGYLTSWQALADYANLITHIKLTTPGGEPGEYDNSPVIAIGGSYGGMLSAWMRIKYPHLIDGAIASSAPMYQNSLPARPGGPGPCNIGDRLRSFPWWIQTCLEMVWTHDAGAQMTYPCNNVDFTDYTRICQQTFNITPSFNAAKIMYGEDKLKYASNIVFSNGGKDQGGWDYYGIKEDINPSTVAVFIPDGEHCGDLGPIIGGIYQEAQDIERFHIARWIDEANRRNNNAI